MFHNNRGQRGVTKIPFAVYSADDNSLTYYAEEEESIPEVNDVYNNKTVSKLYTDFSEVLYEYARDTPWYGDRTLFETVTIDKSLRDIPLIPARWFYEFTNCTSMDLTYLNTTGCTSMRELFWRCYSLTNLDVSMLDTNAVTDMRYMFGECSSLTELDLTNFKTSNLENISRMFYNDSVLYTIYASNDFVTTSVDIDGDVFYGCTTLVGGNGTIFDDSKTSSSMAHCDIAADPGYFMNKDEEPSWTLKIRLVSSYDGNSLSLHEPMHLQYNDELLSFNYIESTDASAETYIYSQGDEASPDLYVDSGYTYVLASNFPVETENGSIAIIMTTAPDGYNLLDGTPILGLYSNGDIEEISDSIPFPVYYTNTTVTRPYKAIVEIPFYSGAPLPGVG